MKRQTIKRILLSTLVWAPLPALASSHSLIPSYEALLQTLAQGDEVRAILKLNECKAHKETHVKGVMTGGMNFAVFNHYTLPHRNQPKEIIATSTHMFVRSQQYGPVYNYVRMRVFKNNTVEILSELQDPKTFEALYSNTYECQLSTDNKATKGVTLYNLSA